MTINESWGYRQNDHNHKTAHHLIRLLVRCASKGANLLLNVGPTPDGEILPIHAKRLAVVGRWLQRHGESIYRTRAGVIPSTPATVSTCRGDVHYVHVLDAPTDCIILQNVPGTVQQARLLFGGTPLVMERQESATTIIIPDELRDPVDTVIELRS